MNEKCEHKCSGNNIGLKIRNAPEVYNLKNEWEFKPGDIISVKTERGVEAATVIPSCSVNYSEIGKQDSFLKKIKTRLSDEELEKFNKNLENEKIALETFREKVQKHELPMKVIEVYYMLDRSRIMFYYYAENKVDFRKLVRELAGIYRTRIEMRQVGIRDEAKIRGGLGPCGLITCCKRFLYDFSSISMKMAKDQEIMLNPSKISGICGRLMCCLKYEQKNYVDSKEGEPSLGMIVQVKDRTGKITTLNKNKKTVMVEFDDGDFKEFSIEFLEKNNCFIDVETEDDKKGEGKK
ncbi:MAG: stage 0 sporulation protein [Candidatus Muiribacterium halophilum]|mgnify:CR=1 FL=1|uniref:Stage 0 sporulation protein n=1 Tax=Muiribacterium halophilum TaxID=2053465 RepID=A0A2N5ZBT0_MUIH1|nr:MAG: stage 0 sporulation protein [Candidatus Muirbacterium halophilum]